MENTMQLHHDRVRENTPEHANRRIDEKTEENIHRYSYTDRATIRTRIRELDHEWDIERALELTSATNALLGLVLGLTVSKKWLALTGISSAFLIQHAIQGWCPPLPVMRFFGVRTQQEIMKERDALEAQLG